MRNQRYAGARTPTGLIRRFHLWSRILLEIDLPREDRFATAKRLSQRTSFEGKLSTFGAKLAVIVAIDAMDHQLVRAFVVKRETRDVVIEIPAQAGGSRAQQFAQV